MKIRIAVCDSSRLRYFALDKDKNILTELEDRVHEASRQRSQDLASDREGQDRGHSLGNNKELTKHEAQLFAREVGELLNRDALSGALKRLYILAPPEFLGLLRKELHTNTGALVAADKSVNVVAESVANIRRQLPEFL